MRSNKFSETLNAGVWFRIPHVTRIAPPSYRPSRSSFRCLTLKQSRIRLDLDVDNMDQPIEQPMFSPAGEADSLAVLLPASEKSTALVPVAATSVTVTEVVTVSTADLDKHIRATMGTCGQLVAERDRVTAEIRRQAKDVLHPALIEMRKRYNNPGARANLLPGISTFEAYLLSIGFCSSILRVWDHRNRQKELEGLLPSDGQKLIGSGSSSRPVGSSSPVGTDHDPDDTATGDATSALVNLGFSRADAKQAIEQALTADAKLVNDLDGLLCNALGCLSKVKPISGNNEATAIIADNAQGVTTANPIESESAGVRLTDEPLLVAPAAAVSKAKLLEGEVGSDQVRGAYAKLRSVFNCVADTAVIESAPGHPRRDRSADAGSASVLAGTADFCHSQARGQGTHLRRRLGGLPRRRRSSDEANWRGGRTRSCR